MVNDRQTILNSFGIRLKKKREEHGFSQEQFAEICGFDRTYISMLETGKRNPSLVNLVKVSNALKISLSDLLEGIPR
jgi:transcriptional regulator with XRE-family HTH domain